MFRKVFIPFVLLALTGPFMAQAEETQPISSCVTIENVSAYPEYDFVYTGMYRFFFANIFPGDNLPLCASNTGGIIAAIKKTDWPNVKYPDIPQGYVTAAENTGLFLIDDSSLTFKDEVPVSDPTFMQNAKLHIDGLRNGVLEISVMYTDTQDAQGNVLTQNGTQQIARVVLDPASPNAVITKKASIPPLVLAALGVLVLLVIRFFYRKLRK